MNPQSRKATSYVYDYATGLLTNETVQISSFQFQISRSYDPLNRPSGYSTAGVSPAQSVVYGYDDAGRLSSITSSVSSATSAVQYSFDPVTGLPVGHTAGIGGAASSLTVSKGFDGFNRLAGVTNTASSLVSSYTYSHNDLSQRTAMQMQFGSPNSFDSTWNYQYDSLGQLSNAWKTANGATVPGRQYGYQFDDIGNRVQTTRGNNTSDLVLSPTPTVTSMYTPNLLNQYSQRTVPAYAEISGLATNTAILSFQTLETDERIRAGRNEEWFHTMMPLEDNSTSAVTNNIRMTGVLPGQGTGGADLINTNQTLTLSVMQTPEIFQYDDDGSLLSDGRFDYTWNAENRLITVSNETALVASYKYDHQGRRISKIVNGIETTFLWNGNHIIGEYSAVATNIYTWGHNGHLVSASLNGTNIFYAHDGNKNVTDLVNSSGDVVAHYEFDPFGNITVKTGELADANSFCFSSEYLDAETGFITYLYRPYNPPTGCFLNRDPIAEEGGVNLYGFIGNDPLKNTDQLGLAVEPNVQISEFFTGATLDFIIATFFNVTGDELGARGLLHYLTGNGAPFLVVAYEFKRMGLEPTPRLQNFPDILEKRIVGTGWEWVDFSSQTADRTFGSKGRYGDNLFGNATLMLRGRLRSCGRGQANVRKYEVEGEIQLVDYYDFNKANRHWTAELKTAFGRNFLYGTTFPVESEWIKVKETDQTRKFVYEN